MSLVNLNLFLWSYLFISNVTFGQKAFQQAQLKFDHLVIFTASNELENILRDSFLTLAEKASTIHHEQGTEGHYFFFYNTYIELLYLKDTVEATTNEPNFGSTYSNRWKTTGEYCPFGFGLNLTPFDTTLTEFKFKVYRSSDTPDDEFYLMSEFNSQQEQPLVYLSMPQHAYLPYESLNDVDKRFEAYMRADQKSYLTHHSGIKRLTEIILTLPASENSRGNINILKGLNQVKLTYGDKYGLTLVFDHQAKGKEMVVSNDPQFTIKY